MLDSQTLISSLPLFYEACKIPIFLLDKNYGILYQCDNFIQLPFNYFIKKFHGQPTVKNRLTTFFFKSELFIMANYDQGDIQYFCAGPFIYYRTTRDSNLKAISFFDHLEIKIEPSLALTKLPYLDDRIIPTIALLYQLVFNIHLSASEIRNSYLERRRAMMNDEQLDNFLYQQRANENREYSYLDERKMLHSIQQGDSDSARIFAAKLVQGRIAKLSGDALRSFKYTIVSIVTLISRSAIEAGVSVERAYLMQDIYIEKIDTCFVNKRIFDIYMNVIIDFCSLVQKYSHTHYPNWVRQCFDYIHRNLHESITLTNLGDAVHMDPAYLSVQFKKITGSSIIQYINKQRVLESKYLLEFTTMTIHEIALTLNFGTQSYYSKVFKEIENILPRDYRKSFAK